MQMCIHLDYTCINIMDLINSDQIKNNDKVQNSLQRCFFLA